MSRSFIWALDRTLSDAIIPDQSGLVNDDNEEILRILLEPHYQIV